MTNRRPLALTGRVCDFLFAALWLGSAIGHAWLLWCGRGELTLAQVAMLVLAVAGSIALVPLGRWMRSRPERLLAVALLICVAHVPADAAAAPAIEILPMLVALLGMAAHGALAASTKAEAHLDLGLATPPPEHALALAPPLSFDLLRRPPPARS